MSVLPVAPIYPDFHQCSSGWNGPLIPPELAGRGAIDFHVVGPLDVRSCWRAADSLPGGDVKKDYTVGGTGVYSLPSHRSLGNCRVLVEIASPNNLRGQKIALSPNSVRGMAFWIIEQCLQSTGGILGGVVTQDFRNVTDYLLDPGTDLENTHFPLTVRFLTVTIDSGEPHPQLGDYAPIFVSNIITLLGEKMVQAVNENDFLRWQTGTDIYVGSLLKTLIGRPWWPSPQDSDSPPAGDTAVYECDTKLGTPSDSGCSHIDYSVGAPSDTLTLAPGLPKILTSNDCAFSIKSDNFVTMTWQAVKIALEVMMDICINNPAISAKGGRAYAKPTPPFRKLFPSGKAAFYNVVPPGVTMTLYQPGYFHP